MFLSPQSPNRGSKIYPEKSSVNQKNQALTRKIKLEHLSPAGYGSDQKWKDYAACLNVDPEIFFPKRGGNGKAARKVCAQCPVRQGCLESAIRDREEYGIWGGVSERERRKLYEPRGKRSAA
jgi:WhiB family redox-sensing transcriptional regulator